MWRNSLYRGEVRLYERKMDETEPQKKKKLFVKRKFLLFLQCCFAIQRRHVKLPATTILVISITIPHIIVYFGVGF